MIENYENAIEEQYKEAIKFLKMLRPKDINDKLQYYVGLHKSILELRRIALGLPILKCKTKSNDL